MSLNTNLLEGQSLFSKLKKRSEFANIRIENNEICPVFNFNSLEPKLNFYHNRPFGINNIFEVDRNFFQFWVYHNMEFMEMHGV